MSAFLFHHYLPHEEHSKTRIVQGGIEVALKHTGGASEITNLDTIGAVTEIPAICAVAAVAAIMTSRAAPTVATTPTLYAGRAIRATASRRCQKGDSFGWTREKLTRSSLCNRYNCCFLKEMPQKSASEYQIHLAELLRASEAYLLGCRTLSFAETVSRRIMGPTAYHSHLSSCTSHCLLTPHLLPSGRWLVLRHQLHRLSLSQAENP